MRQLELQLRKYGGKHLFAGFEIGFIAFAVLFLEHLKSFCLDWRYGCQDTSENIYFLALKLGLLHSPFYFNNIGYHFASIGCTVAKIRAKTFIFRLSIWVYCIHHSILTTSDIILRQLEVRLPR